MNKRIMRLTIVLTIVSVLFFFVGEEGFIAAKMQGYKALKVFAHVKSSELTPEFNIYETENFIIKYTDKDEDIVRDIGKIFEKSRKVEGARYGYYPKNKTIVFLYNDQESMWDYEQSIRGQAVMGLYNMGIIHVLSPKAYMSQKQLYERNFEKGGPILHEYVHYVLDEKSGGNIELWLTEGIALYEEYEVDGVEWAPDFSYESYFTGTELRKDFMGLEETQSYKQSYDIVKGLIEQHGKESIMALLEELKNGNTLEEAFQGVFGYGPEEYMDSEAWKG
jgi:hypothetical protein